MGWSHWGNIDRFNFDTKQLSAMKKSCEGHCFSTLNHNLAYCYNDARVIKWSGNRPPGGVAGRTASGSAGRAVSPTRTGSAGASRGWGEAPVRDRQPFGNSPESCMAFAGLFCYKQRVWCGPWI